MIVIPIADYQHFSFAECLLFLNRSPRECLHQVREGSLYKLLAPEGSPVLIKINEDVEQQSLIAEVLQGGSNETYIRDFLNKWMHLDGRMDDFYAFAAKDNLLGPLTKSFKGLRLIGIPDLFEAITWTITGQQINLSFAYTLKQRLVQAFGYVLEEEGISYYLYPHPAVIASLQPEDLTVMQFSRTKAEGIIRVAKLMAAGALTEEILKQMPYEEARETLVAIKGIGNWSANYVLMKFAQHPQALPLEDAALHNVLRNQLALPAKPALQEVKALTSHWKNHAAYATFYCWRSLYKG
ncbi:DNA-3-methyladenine glycosylase [Chitinophaga sp. SYP-B3965]|uniref:DNA-3-methyladenine glycosylase family protein n=1 Tax=Chitinophaga sp. SYP-B3965 TaxID=2663120 RepID=UPI001299DDEA|nr:DNA-3-methyladenine glycosylase [Chitinophaga sp. SYP-B3965]MRG45372.1 DNA-3-methyladenine glycosylase [Chitinophaga sp. SYP-B3965]